MKNKSHWFICCFGSGPGRSWGRTDIFWFLSRALDIFRGLRSLERTSLLRSGGRRVCRQLFVDIILMTQTLFTINLTITRQVATKGARGGTCPQIHVLPYRPVPYISHVTLTILALQSGEQINKTPKYFRTRTHISGSPVSINGVHSIR